MKKIILSCTVLFAIAMTSCESESTSENENSVETEESATTTNENETTMNSYTSLFEIPATDMSRAASFYEAVLDVKIETMEMEGLEIGVLPYEDQLVSAVIMKGEDIKPSAEGVTVYLNCGDDLQVALDKVEQNGGTVIVPKTPHADGSGFFALFLDTEGNRLGLNSPN